MAKHRRSVQITEAKGQKSEFGGVFDLDDKFQPPKPFVKWVGGKRALLPQLDRLLPENIGTYLEPFVGGGAMFFYLSNDSLFEKAILSDLNSELIDAWRMVRGHKRQDCGVLL